MTMILEHTTDPFSLQIYPFYDYSYSEVFNREINRTKTGALGIYTNSPSYFKISVPVKWVNSSDVSIINSWWVTNTNLNFYPDTDVSGDYKVVRLMGKENPFQKYAIPYAFTEWDGILVFETV